MKGAGLGIPPPRGTNRTTCDTSPHLHHCHLTDKMRAATVLTFVLWINIVNLITGKDNFKVEITSIKQKNIFRVGEYVNLTCRMQDCSTDMSFTWTTVQDTSHGGKMMNEQNVSHLVFRNISAKHNNVVVCKASCGKISREKSYSVQVYSFPEDPVLPSIKSLKVNQEQMLRCTVYNVYPLERFIIEWLVGDRLRHTDEPEDILNSIQNFSSVFNYTPSVAELGLNISCRVTLNLDLPSEEKSRTTTVEYGPGTITVSSNKTFVKLGEPLELTCYADGNPRPRILWWKMVGSKPIPQSQNETLFISNASWSQAGLYRCEASNVVGTLQTMVTVIVQGLPNIPKILLDHEGDTKEGDNITIRCSSDRGSKALTLSSESQKQVAKDLNGSTVLLNIASIKTTDAGIYICEAKNDFGSRRSMINITVKAPPRDPKVEVYPSMQVLRGQNVTVRTTVTGFPAPLTFLRRDRDGFELESTDGAFHLLNYTSDDVGSYTVRFINELGNVSQTFQLSSEIVQHSSEMPDLPTGLLSAAGSASLLTVAALLVRYLKKARNASRNISMN